VSYQAGQVLEVSTGDVANGGWCVARPDSGPVVFVRHALPGERVLARITEVTTRFARADAVEVLSASPDRVEPPCPHARPGGCGGCDWQHADLAAQRALKATVVSQQLRRLAGVDRAVTVEPVPGGEPAGPGLGWRTRVQFAVGDDEVAGLRGHRSHDVIDVGECLIAHPAITGLGITGRRWPGAASVEAVAGATERAVIVAGKRGPGAGGRLPAAAAAAARSVEAESVLARGGRNGALASLRGRGYLSQRAAGRSWRVSPGAFWQVHPGVADALVQVVLEALAPRGGDVALDLYCGAGLFAGALAPLVGPDGVVIGVESDASAVRDARHNLRETPWARVHRGDVAAVLRRGGLPAPRLVVADPPRSGLAHEVVGYLADAPGGTERFAYVSCDPATLARDIGLLLARGWALADLRAFDAFPMTHHVECVAILVRASDSYGQR
jgi:tRNA/tmRNA/rRNA uracil-C5-methylase (TrmA/RlmC/RlmD family)